MQTLLYRSVRWLGSSDGDRKLSPMVMAIPIVAVFGLNLLILAYAVRISLPEAVDASATSQGAGDTGLVTQNTAVTANVSRSASGSASDVGNTAAFDIEDDEWDMEPLRVVNIFALPSVAERRADYLRHCASCHGPEGGGNGPAADYLLPPPRDFVGSPFRYSSPGAEQEHVLADLQRTITQGVPRSAMPGFGGVLTESQIAGLAEYVHAIRQQGEQVALPEEGIGVGVRPPITPALVARGKELFTTLACNTCHGDSGRGDGMNAEALVDFQGRPVRPADFTSGLFKTGQTPEDLCRTILSGVPGTPMVAYEAAVTQDNDDDEETVNTLDAWALVSYIRSLRSAPQPPGRASGALIEVRHAADEGMMADPTHIAWLGVCPTLVAVKPLQHRPEETTSIAVRAVRTAEQLAICLEWQDETLDLARGNEVYPDAAAMTFGLGDEPPPLPIGLGVEDDRSGDPVNIWHWSADRQYEVTTGQPSALVAASELQGDWYLFVQGSTAKIPEVEPIDQPDRAIAIRATLDANAHGLGPIVIQPPSSQHTSTTATWSGGMWRIVIVRSLSSADEQDVQFTSARRIPVSFALYNGSKGDHAAVKLVSAWHWLEVMP
ncbi:MAG: c-type cytochrome [Planctomycetes bacterium]|nr:c-type cytochrome [Planctomycetota bacterium]